MVSPLLTNDHNFNDNGLLMGKEKNTPLMRMSNHPSLSPNIHPNFSMRKQAHEFPQTSPDIRMRPADPTQMNSTHQYLFQGGLMTPHQQYRGQN